MYSVTIIVNLPANTEEEKTYSNKQHLTLTPLGPYWMKHVGLFLGTYFGSLHLQDE